MGPAKQRSRSETKSEGALIENTVCELKQALEDEIEAIKTKYRNSEFAVHEGRLSGESAGLYIYSFKTTTFPPIADDTPVSVTIEGVGELRGTLLQSKDLEVVIGVNRFLGDTVDEATIHANAYELLARLIECFNGELEESGPKKFRLSHHVFCVSAPEDKPAEVTLPQLEEHPNPMVTVGKHHREAISSCLGSKLTYIWGPPGTGKTATLARVVECLIKNNKRVLVVAHANAAVDEATEDIAELLQNTEFYTQGKIVRVGNCQKVSLAEQYPNVLREQIARGQTIALVEERSGLDKELDEIRAKQALCPEARRLERERKTALCEHSQIAEEISALDSSREMLCRDYEAQSTLYSRLSDKLRMAESSGGFKRLLTAKPEKVRREMVIVQQRSLEITGYIFSCDERRAALAARVERAAQAIKEKHAEIQKILAEMEVSEAQLPELESELSTQAGRLEKRIRQLGDEILQAENKVIENAAVICTTLTKTFSSKEVRTQRFDTLIVDEASMAPMPYVYWAISRCSESVVFVGDFLQLPPIATANDSEAVGNWMKRSIYQHAGILSVHDTDSDHRVKLLHEQYRMHPEISFIPNTVFYDGRLKDGEDAVNHVVSDDLGGGALVLINTSLARARATKLKRSRINIYSAVLTAAVAKRLYESVERNGHNIAIIAPYRPQVKLIGKILEDIGLARLVGVATVHRYQGGQASIVIVDTVESPPLRVAPMLRDKRGSIDSDGKLLLNVALTRAKCKVVMIADTAHLEREMEQEESLNRVIDIFKRKGCLLNSRDIEGEQFISTDYLRRFIEDANRATSELVLSCPAAPTSDRLFQILKLAADRGVKVMVLLPSLDSQPAGERHSQGKLVSLESAGIEVKRSGVGVGHQQVAIVDRKIVWAGTINLLGSDNSSGVMRRFEYQKMAEELAELLRVDDKGSPGVKSWKGESGHPGERHYVREKCKACSGEGVYLVLKGKKYMLHCEAEGCGASCEVEGNEELTRKEPCRECGATMILKRNSGNGQYFWGCEKWKRNNEGCSHTVSIR